MKNPCWEHTVRRRPAVLANKVGLSREYVARLEAARHDPRLTVLERIAKALKVSVAELLN